MSGRAARRSRERKAAAYARLVHVEFLTRGVRAFAGACEHVACELRRLGKAIAAIRQRARA